MILTREAQEKIVSEYSKEHTTKEVLGFIDGIDATISLMIKIQMDQNKFYKSLHHDKKAKVESSK